MQAEGDGIKAHILHICGGGIDVMLKEGIRALVRRKQGFAITPCMLGRVSRRYVARMCVEQTDCTDVQRGLLNIHVRWKSSPAYLQLRCMFADCTWGNRMRMVSLRQAPGTFAFLFAYPVISWVVYGRTAICQISSVGRAAHL